MSWYYMTAGLILYALDNAIRLSSTIATEVTLKDFSMAVKDSDFPSAPSSLSSSPSSTSALLPVDSTAEFFEVNSSSPSNGTGTGIGIGIGIGVDGSHTGVTKISYTVLSKDRRSSHPLCHLMGQYVYINIPSISSLEWHPFTISSAPTDSVTTHHIKVMGGLNNGQWTAKLHKLAMKLQDDKVRAQAHTAMHSVIDSNAVINPAHLGRRFLSVQGSYRERERGGERGRGGETATSTSNRVRDRDDNEESKDQNRQHQQQQQQQQQGQGHGEGQGQGEREGEREGEEESLSLSSITVNIDGPYGLSVTHELHKYTHVLLIGGGIGVTPLHSCLRHLVLMKMCASTSHVEAQAMADTEAGSGAGKGTGLGAGRGRNNLDDDSDNLMPFPFPDLKSVELLWSVKKIEESYIFADTVRITLGIFSTLLPP